MVLAIAAYIPNRRLPAWSPAAPKVEFLGILPGVIGVIQATEAVKIILGIGETLKGRLLLYDALGMKFRELKLRRDKDCPVCGDHPTVTKLIDYQQFCGINPMPNEPVVASAVIDALELKEKIDRGDNFVLLDVREPHEYQIARIPGSILIPLGDLPKRLHELERTPTSWPNANPVAAAKKPSTS